jgi:hypothetical protein
MRQASGRWRLLADADLATSIDQRDAFMSAIIPGETDIVIGSQEAARAVRIDEPWYRHAIGRGFNWIVQATVFRGIGDTQCSFNLFRGDASELLFQQQRDSRVGTEGVSRHPPRGVECAQRRIPKRGR